jgi:hypothetical protein
MGWSLSPYNDEGDGQLTNLRTYWRFCEAQYVNLSWNMKLMLACQIEIGRVVMA